jgi:Na+/proline symporter
MMILLILVLLGLLLVAGLLAYWVIEERSDETWWPGGRKPRTPTRLSGYLRLRR